MTDKIIYTKSIGNSIISVVSNNDVLRIVVATPDGMGDYIGKPVGEKMKLSEEELAIRIVNKIFKKLKLAHIRRKKVRDTYSLGSKELASLKLCYN